jgi:hypothetical protein
MDLLTCALAIMGLSRNSKSALSAVALVLLLAGELLPKWPSLYPRLVGSVSAQPKVLHTSMLELVIHIRGHAAPLL